MTSGASATSSAALLRAAEAPTGGDPDVATLGPIQLLQRLQERGDTGLRFRIVRRLAHKHPDAPHAVALLRANRQRPRRRTPEPRNECPAFH
jgi:hypothetical protein